MLLGFKKKRELTIFWSEGKKSYATQRQTQINLNISMLYNTQTFALLFALSKINNMPYVVFCHTRK